VHLSFHSPLCVSLLLGWPKQKTCAITNVHFKGCSWQNLLVQGFYMQHICHVEHTQICWNKQSCWMCLMASLCSPSFSTFLQKSISWEFVLGTAGSPHATVARQTNWVVRKFATLLLLMLLIQPLLLLNWKRFVLSACRHTRCLKTLTKFLIATCDKHVNRLMEPGG